MSAKLLVKKKSEEKRLKKEVENKTKSLSDALDKNQMLLRELHHRVKNNMQMVVSLLRLQSYDIEDKKLQDILIFDEEEHLKLKDLIIPFSKFSKPEEHIYHGHEKIPFKKRHSDYQAIFRHEFTE